MVLKGMNLWSALEQLSNDALLEETKRLAARERRATAALIAAIAEVDDRRRIPPLWTSQAD
jgi:hypothetical protein